MFSLAAPSLPPATSAQVVFLVRPVLSLMDTIASFIKREERSGGSGVRTEFRVVFVPRESLLCRKRLVEVNTMILLVFNHDNVRRVSRARSDATRSPSTCSVSTLTCSPWSSLTPSGRRWRATRPVSPCRATTLAPPAGPRGQDCASSRQELLPLLGSHCTCAAPDRPACVRFQRATSGHQATGLPQGSAQATTQTHPALSEPPLGAPAVPSGLNAASGAGGASV